MNLPRVKKPCSNCPFRKDSLKGWLGEERMQEIVNADSFTCHKHKSPNRLQCAGHMLLKGDENAFNRVASAMDIDTQVTGRDLVFTTKEECVNHHK